MIQCIAVIGYMDMHRVRARWQLVVSHHHRVCVHVMNHTAVRPIQGFCAACIVLREYIANMINYWTTVAAANARADC